MKFSKHYIHVHELPLVFPFLWNFLLSFVKYLLMKSLLMRQNPLLWENQTNTQEFNIVYWFSNDLFKLPCPVLLGKGNLGWQMCCLWLTWLCTFPGGLFQTKDLPRRSWSVGWVSFQWKSEQDGYCMQKSLSVMETWCSRAQTHI